ncbi:MAG: phytanoyl-CoA dioxygenase family protein [Pseudomonadota bacterium]
MVHRIRSQDILRDGFTVIPDVVPRSLIEPAIDAICAWGNFDLDDPNTWYSNAPENTGIVPLHHGQALWDIRQCPSLYEAFVEIWGDRSLRVSMDRCCFRPPWRSGEAGVGQGNIHWDADPLGGDPGWVQGTVYLTDVGPDAGGFQCAPPVFRDLDAWLNDHGDTLDRDQPPIGNEDIVQVEGKAGDVVVWHPLLPHGPAPNHTARPRLSFFVKMDPMPSDRTEVEDRYEDAVSWWREKRAPPWWRDLPGQQDPEPGPVADLSPLGRKLIGLDDWG